MANTWNKIKKRLRWKKGSSRRRNRNKHNKQHQHRTNPPKNTTTIHPNTPKSVQSTANMITLPNNTKKKSSKSNIFGCLTNVPAEHKNECNVQPPNRSNPPSLNNNYNSNGSNIIEQTPHSVMSTFNGSNSSSSSSLSIHSEPATPKQTQPQTEQLQTGYNPPFPSVSPTKSKTNLADNSSNYIAENTAAITGGSISRDQPILHPENAPTAHYDKICTTPTPNTITTGGITPNTSSSEWIGGNDHNYDI